MKFISLIPVLLLSMIVSLYAQAGETIETRVYETKRVNGNTPVIDGRLDDPAWETVEWSGDFIQREPADGEPPTQQTKFKVLYDDDALYFAFRAHDDPELVTSMLARRDWFPGDWVEVNIDSHNDNRTAFSFTLSLSGTRGDEFVSQDGNNWDGNWDPIWQGATQIDLEGWTAEMRIPLSQLRFSSEEEQTWGLQVQRRIFREEERSTWQSIPKDVSGWVSKFGELRGIRGIKPKRRIELLPYTMGKTELFKKVEGDPFLDGSHNLGDIGLDGKIGVTTDLTLDLTVNPDFGQVEADPSEVNLSEFETFFSEKRPFFIEGNNILDLRLAPAITGGHFTSDKLFYSRRIGRPPIYGPDLADDEYADQPDNSHILGAFKLSGKTQSGLSIGLLESVTKEEKAEIDNSGQRRKETVEPLTNYFVGRLQQDFREGNTQIGAMGTAVHRKIENDYLDFMRSQAYAGGVDFLHYFHNRDYLLEGNVLGSTIRGSAEAILDAQTSSARYYQRPDNDHRSVDSTRTALDGYAGSIRLQRTSNNKFVGQTGVAWRSPGFEINDLGYMRRADEVNQFTWVGYYLRNPFSIFNRLSVNGNQWLNWDFGGNFLYAMANTNTSITFRNNYYYYASITRLGEVVSNTELRGGPASKWPGAWEYSTSLSSDSRKKFYFGLGGYRQITDEGYSDYKESWLDLYFRPSNAMRLTLSPGISWNDTEMQYITTASFGEEDRYLFGSLDQKTVAVTFRFDYCIAPNLTVQYYGAPFISAGEYSQFKRITDPMADRYKDRFELYPDDRIDYNSDDEYYNIDEDGDGMDDYGFDLPDFNFRDFNSNLVIRWEYSPGSVLYVVWSQSRTDYVSRGDFKFDRDIDGLFAVHPNNVFLVKLNRWFSL
jgi:hypothetical protein